MAGSIPRSRVMTSLIGRFVKAVGVASPGVAAARQATRSAGVPVTRRDAVADSSISSPACALRFARGLSPPRPFSLLAGA